MSEKEQSIIRRELWLLISQNMQGCCHSLEILGRVAKIIGNMDDDSNDITPQKRKVVEELCLLRDFLATITEDLKEIEQYLGASGIVPDMPAFNFQDSLWKNGGDRLTTMQGNLDNYQNQQCESIFKLQNLAE